jgi:hypothetical protein
MKLGAAVSSKTLVTIYQSTRCPNSEKTPFFIVKSSNFDITSPESALHSTTRHSADHSKSSSSSSFFGPVSYCARCTSALGLLCRFEVLILSNIAVDCSFAFGSSGNQFLSLQPAVETGLFRSFLQLSR